MGEETGHRYAGLITSRTNNGKPGPYGPGCTAAGSNVYYNPVLGAQRTALPSRPLICVGEEQAPLATGKFIFTKEPFCSERIASEEDCETAAKDHGYRFGGRTGNYGPGCVVVGTTAYYNANTESFASTHPLLCSPPYPEMCNPNECDQWTCKNWCKCFKAH